MEYKKFKEIGCEGEFFNSLKADYPEFEDWFKRKSENYAYVMYSESNLQAFLYIKDESKESMDEEDEIIKSNVRRNRMKVGTFKIDAHGTKCGERFIKKIVDEGIAGGYDDVYMTIFSKHKTLIELVGNYGFEYKGDKKNGEGLYVKSLVSYNPEKNIIYNYPLLSIKGKSKYVLSVYPTYHTKLFPDSILKNEEDYKYDLVKDVSETNTIRKIYICFMKDTMRLKKGDLVCIYRTSDNLGPAFYRSVVTSVCQVEEVKTKADFVDLDDYLNYTRNSVFGNEEKSEWYRKKNVIVIKMTYNVALTKRVTRGYMINNLGISPDSYWGFLEITDNQFNGILKKGEIYENIIVD